jgi:hypothetical protein
MMTDISRVVKMAFRLSDALFLGGDLRLKQPLERNEMIEIIFIYDAGIQLAMIDEHGAAGSAGGKF